MEFRQYHNFETLSGLKDDWRDLLQQSAIHVPFLTFEYLQAWWQTRGGGEWPENSQLCMIAAFQDGKLVGIAPLFLADNLRGRSSLLFVGAIEVSDFLDFIVPPANAPDFIHGLLDFLIQQQDLLSWEVIDLYNILEDSPSINILQHEAEQRGWRHDKTLLHPSPYIPLPDDYEAYLAGIDKKQRHEIRRKLRNVEQSPLEGKLYFTESPDSLEADVDAFIEMMAQDPNKRDFLTPTMRQHLRNTARIAFEAGWLQLAFFNLDGRKAAGNLSFNYNNRLWLYNSGWEWDYREYSPGWVLLAYLIQWAVENGIQEFDFMRGDESYKYKFGGIDRHIYRLALEP